MNAPPFDWLESLAAVAASKNLSEAAVRLGLSQPALSQKLIRMEKVSPLPLFQSVGRLKTLTPYGRALAEVARVQKLGLGDAYTAVNRAYASAEHLTLKVACRAELFELVAPWFEFPGRVELQACSSAESTQRLLRHEVDVAVTHEVPDATEFTARRLSSSLATISVHKRWLKKKPLSLSLAGDESFLTRVPAILYDGAGHLLTDWVKSRGLSLSDLRIAVVVKDWRLIRSLVEQEKGFALLPDYLKFTSPEIESVPLPERIVPRFSFFAVYSKSLRKIPGFQPLPLLAVPR